MEVLIGDDTEEVDRGAKSKPAIKISKTSQIQSSNGLVKQLNYLAVNMSIVESESS